MTITAEDIRPKVDEICGRYPSEEASLIEVLHDISEEFRWLPGDALKRASENLEIPIARVYAVATFYKGFSLTPRGEKVVKVCKGTACHVRGADRCIEEFERLLEIEMGETTEDMKYTIEIVNCVGACAAAPVIVVNDKYYKNSSAHTVHDILDNPELSAERAAPKSGGDT
ncbi:MAG TPA: NAD(P)H-dependent oxidoreductase subunit E [bacterium]|jgi:NADH-quinone oxidoreductase subunit E